MKISKTVRQPTESMKTFGKVNHGMRHQTSLSRVLGSTSRSHVPMLRSASFSASSETQLCLFGGRSGLSHSGFGVVSLFSENFTDQISKSDQTLHRAPPHLPHLQRPAFSRQSAQWYGLVHVFTVFLFLTTFFLRSSSYIYHNPSATRHRKPLG